MTGIGGSSCRVDMDRLSNRRQWFLFVNVAAAKRFRRERTPRWNSSRLRRRSHPMKVTGACRGDRQSAVGIFVQLVAQRADRDAEDVRRMGAIAEAMLQRFQDEIAF